MATWRQEVGRSLVAAFRATSAVWQSPARQVPLRGHRSHQGSEPAQAHSAHACPEEPTLGQRAATRACQAVSAVLCRVSTSEALRKGLPPRPPELSDSDRHASMLVVSMGRRGAAMLGRRSWVRSRIITE